MSGPGVANFVSLLGNLTAHIAITQRVETTPSRHRTPPPRFVLKMGREAIMTPVLMDSIRQCSSLVG
jgi:hypothetical protein